MFNIVTTNPSANVSRTIRFDEELFYKLKKVSRLSNISFNALVLQCCSYALSELEDPSISEVSEEEIEYLGL